MRSAIRLTILTALAVALSFVDHSAYAVPIDAASALTSGTGGATDANILGDVDALKREPQLGGLLGPLGSLTSLVGVLKARQFLPFPFFGPEFSSGSSNSNLGIAVSGGSQNGNAAVDGGAGIHNSVSVSAPAFSQAVAPRQFLPPFGFPEFEFPNAAAAINPQATPSAITGNSNLGVGVTGGSGNGNAAVNAGGGISNAHRA